MVPNLHYEHLPVFCATHLPDVSFLLTPDLKRILGTTISHLGDDHFIADKRIVHYDHRAQSYIEGVRPKNGVYKQRKIYDMYMKETGSVTSHFFPGGKRRRWKDIVYGSSTQSAYEDDAIYLNLTHNETIVGRTMFKFLQCRQEFPFLQFDHNPFEYTPNHIREETEGQSQICVSVHCINAYFIIDSRLNLVKTQANLEKSGIVCLYRPHRYSALQVRCPPNATFLVFHTGKIICTGIRSIAELDKALLWFSQQDLHNVYDVQETKCPAPIEWERLCSNDSSASSIPVGAA